MAVGMAPCTRNGAHVAGRPKGRRADGPTGRHVRLAINLLGCYLWPWAGAVPSPNYPSLDLALCDAVPGLHLCPELSVLCVCVWVCASDSAQGSCLPERSIPRS